MTADIVCAGTVLFSVAIVSSSTDQKGPLYFHSKRIRATKYKERYEIRLLTLKIKQQRYVPGVSSFLLLRNRYMMRRIYKQSNNIGNTNKQL